MCAFTADCSACRIPEAPSASGKPCSDAVHDESFFTRVGSRLFQEIETDQQVAAQADAFPAHKHEEHVVRQDQRQHGEHEEIHVAEEAVVAAFVTHIPDRVNVNQEADSSDHQNHDAGKRVQKESPVRYKSDGVPAGHLHGPRRQPCKQYFLKHAMLGLRSQQLKYGAH